MKENLDKVFFPSEILHKYCLPTICIAPKFWALYSSLCRSCGILHTDWKFEKKGISELGNFGGFTCLITNCQQKMLFQVFKFCTKMFWNKMVLFICYLIFKLPKKGQSIIFSCGGSIWWVYFGDYSKSTNLDSIKTSKKRDIGDFPFIWINALLEI